MNSAAKIYVVRHGQSGFNAGMSMTNYDSSLTSIGKKQARKIANEFRNVEFTAIFSSGLKRSFETAEIINEGRSLHVTKEPSTNERSIYIYAQNIGIEDSELEEKLANKFKDIEESKKMDFKYTNDMESAREGAIRLLNLIKKASRKHKSKNILIVSHGNLMRSLLTYLGFASYDELPTGSIENVGYFILESLNYEKFKVTKTSKIYKKQNSIRIW